MRSVVQRIAEGDVTVDGEIVGRAGKGLMVLVGFNEADSVSDKGLQYMMDKILNLRIFEDKNEKMNLSVQDVDGDLLIVPNFTLYGDARKGRRPSFTASAPATSAKDLFDQFVSELRAKYSKVETGIFQADMAVRIINDGPVTLMLDSEKNF